MFFVQFVTGGAFVKSARPRLLFISRNLPPLIGGMERLSQHIVLELASRADLEVIGPPGCRAFLPSGADVREIGSSRLGRFLIGAAWRVFRAALVGRFDWVIAGSGLVAPIALLAARLRRGRCAVYLHGLDIVVEHRMYRWVWLPLIRRIDLCLVNSRNTADLAMRAGVPAERIHVLHPGVTSVPTVNSDVAEAWRDRLGLKGKKVMLSVGRLTRRKGLLEFVESALPAIVARNPQAVLVVIGNEAPDALAGRAEGIGTQIREAASRRGLEDHLKMLGPCDQAELDAAYQASDLLVFPVRPMKGDVEGFGMVAVEAAAHGLPTVAFSVGGVSDAVETGASGWLADPGDYATFAAYVSEALSAAASPVTSASCRQFAQRFAWSLFGQRLRKYLQIDPSNSHPSDIRTPSGERSNR